MSGADEKMQTNSGNDPRSTHVDAYPYQLAEHQRVEQGDVQYRVQPKEQPRAVLLKTPKDATQYFMNHSKRGKALIFNFKTFDKEIEERAGSESDVSKLVETFSKLKFNVEICNGNGNMTYDALMEKLYNVTCEDHTDCDCLVIVFMSHGSNGELWAYDKLFKTEELWENFTEGKCLTLAGKPKLFFIQACRGNSMQEGTVLMDKAACDGNKEPYTIPNHSDFLIFFATIKGHLSVRDKNHGTWFIQSLCSELLENGRKSSLLTLLTAVNKRVAVDHEHPPGSTNPSEVKKQQPMIFSTLNCEVYFQ